jgi:hypothetical protein
MLIQTDRQTDRQTALVFDFGGHFDRVLSTKQNGDNGPQREGRKEGGHLIYSRCQTSPRLNFCYIVNTLSNKLRILS